MKPPHIRDEASRDENGFHTIQYTKYGNRVSNMGPVEKKSQVEKKNTYKYSR